MTVVTHPYRLTHLKELEAESVYVIREVAAQFERPALLFSGGKDSIVLSQLARKAFWPAKIPFPLLHIDTGHNFPETLTYRDMWMEKIGAKLHRPLRPRLHRPGPGRGRKGLQRQPQHAPDRDAAGRPGGTQD